jgi:hypothetical protein
MFELKFYYVIVKTRQKIKTMYIKGARFRSCVSFIYCYIYSKKKGLTSLLSYLILFFHSYVALRTY